MFRRWATATISPPPAKRSCWVSPVWKGVLMDWLLVMSLTDDSPHFPNPFHACASFSSRENTHRGLIWTARCIMALSIHSSCKWEKDAYTHSSQTSFIWLGIWLRGREMVICRLSRKISRIIKGDRWESLVLMISCWPGWKSNLQLYICLPQPEKNQRPKHFAKHTHKGTSCDWRRHQRSRPNVSWSGMKGTGPAL